MVRYLRRLWVRVYLWLAERLYHELAWAYEFVAWIVSGGQWDCWRRQVLDYVTESRVLELGFGTGALLVAGRRRGLMMFGVEPSREMQSVARRRLDRARLDVPRVYAVSQALPFADGAFDSVVATFPTRDIADEETLCEVWRVLRNHKPGQTPSSFVITGLGVVAGRSWGKRLIAWLLGSFEQETIAWFEAKARRVGYHMSMYVPQGKQVQVPVLTLRKV